MESCPICLKASSLLCSNCKKTVYCGKDHQKLHRKEHKAHCFPASIKSDAVLGHHLQATRDIAPGERIFREEPLIQGPRSNLAKFHKICLGCCNPIIKDNYNCPKCRWPVCDEKCAKAKLHADFECPIFLRGKVPPAQSQEGYLAITFLRCVLLKDIDPDKWTLLKKFESHSHLRKSMGLTLTQFAIHFIRERCQLVEIDPEAIDFVVGVITVNGYGDASTFSVKLYPNSAKLSHSCIPNTRTRTLKGGKGLEILATVQIPKGQPLTQLYGRMLKGTHRRQELLQAVYYFSCGCERCKDPKELGTFFSGIKCPNKKCSVGYLLPKDPLDLSPNAKWICTKEECRNSSSFQRCVPQALEEIGRLAGTQEDDALYAEYEVYHGDSEDYVVGGVEEKVEYVWKMVKVLKKLEKETVHKNHYGLLPLKTALVATIHSIIANNWEVVDDRKLLLEEFLRMVKELVEVVEVLLPGMTSERGLLLFYLSQGMKFSLGNKLKDEVKALEEESLKIMRLEDEDDDHRKLVEKFLL